MNKYMYAAILQNLQKRLADLQAQEPMPAPLTPEWRAMSTQEQQRRFDVLNDAKSEARLLACMTAPDDIQAVLKQIEDQVYALKNLEQPEKAVQS